VNFVNVVSEKENTVDRPKWLMYRVSRTLIVLPQISADLCEYTHIDVILQISERDIVAKFYDNII